MAGQYTKILATDYNNIQTKISSVMGIGSGDYGYGQSLSSSQVSVGAKISASQWNNLRTDLIRARQYQTGITQSVSSAIIGSKITDSVSNSIITEYNNIADLAINERNLSTLPLVAQSTLTTWNTSTKTVAWNGTISHTITATFASANAMRNFFNCGCSVKFYASRTGGTAGTKNSSWTTMLTNMGTISFSRTTTTKTGSGTANNIGYSSLTTSDQLIFQKLTETPLYSPNQYDIYARISGSAIIFTINFSDLSTANTEATYLGVSSTWRIDESIDGTLTSTVQALTATGSNVSSPTPTITFTSM